jgi:tRNA(Arg) A34 adenosine deaminase TadA
VFSDDKRVAYSPNNVMGWIPTATHEIWLLARAGAPTMNYEKVMARAFEIARDAAAHGNHPFGALLIDKEGRIVLEAENTVVVDRDCTGHAETNLVRKAGPLFDEAQLRTLTLITSTEPCAMCAGAIHWCGIKRIVFGCPEDELYRITGASNKNTSNPTLRLPAAKLYSLAGSDVEVIGPVLNAEGVQIHESFGWGSP